MVTHRVYLVLIEVKIILGEGGEEEHDLGLDNGVYVRIGRIVAVHCTARSSCPSAGRLRATRSHACTRSRFRDNVVGMDWKKVEWKDSVRRTREFGWSPFHKTCPRFRRAAKYGHGNLPPTILSHVGFFGLRFNFCGTAHCTSTSGRRSMVSLDKGLNVSNITCETV